MAGTLKYYAQCHLSALFFSFLPMGLLALTLTGSTREAARVRSSKPLGRMQGLTDSRLFYPQGWSPSVALTLNRRTPSFPPLPFGRGEGRWGRGEGCVARVLLLLLTVSAPSFLLLRFPKGERVGVMGSIRSCPLVFGFLRPACCILNALLMLS